MPKQSLAQKSVYWLKVISLGLILGLGIQFAEAWTSPTVAPPGGNVSGPITNGAIAQYKTGMLGVNSTTVPLSALEVGGGGNALIGGSIYIGGNLYTAGSSASSSFGALTIQGSKNGWSGINFKNINGLNTGTLMMHPSYSGFYNAGDSNWRWLVDNAGNSYQPGSMILGGKATSVSTTVGDAGTTMVTKDYVDAKVGAGSIVAGCSFTVSGCWGGAYTGGWYAIDPWGSSSWTNHCPAGSGSMVTSPTTNFFMCVQGFGPNTFQSIFLVSCTTCY